MPGQGQTPSEGMPFRWLNGLVENRWSLLTVGLGLVAGGVQIVHTVEMLRFGLTGVVLEGVVPLLLALATASAGGWLWYRGYALVEQRRIVLWMLSVALLSGLLFVWALSHQFIVAGEYLSEAAYGPDPQYASGGLFPHSRFVTATNLTSGALIGLGLGVYNVQSRRHYRAVQRERERVALQRTRLSVLNRVLRHNLRNDATVILGNMREIMSRSDGQLGAHAETAAEKTTELVALGEKARQIDETLGGDVRYTDLPDLRAFVADLVDDSQWAGSAEFDVEIQEDVSIRTNRRVLTQVLEELIDNAVTHSESEPVRIRIAATPTADGWLTLTVADDGPGLPEHEQAIIDAGEETDLEHASSLGLWLVKWGTAALGGELSFERNEWGGTTARLRLPASSDDLLQGPLGAGSGTDRPVEPGYDQPSSWPRG